MSKLLIGCIMVWMAIGPYRSTQAKEILDTEKISPQLPKLKEHLQRLLNNDPTLTELDLSWNRIGDQGAEAIAKALVTNSFLAQLNLGYNQVGAQGAEAIAKALVSNSSLTALHLWNNQIGNQGAEAIGKALLINFALTNLSLNNSQIGDQGADALGKGLVSNSSLTALHLWNNQIGNQGAEAIGKGLVSNSSLAQLDLSWNQIGNQGAEAIGKGLVSNSSLTALDLWNNQIGDQGAEAIGKGLVSNSSLTALDLWNNQIGNQGAEAIAKALATNFALKQLHLQFNHIDQQLNNQIQIFLSHNQELAKNKSGPKLAEKPKSESNNNNNQLAQSHSTLVASFIEAHKQSKDITKEFSIKCLMPFYTASKVSEKYKHDLVYQVLIQKYQKALETQDAKIIEFVKDTISEQCNTSPLFESLVDIYFGSIKGTDQPYNIVSENLVKIHKHSAEVTKGFSQACLVPLYVSGKVPEAYKQDSIYQLLSQQYQKASQNKDTTMMKSLEQIILKQCNKLPLFESLTEMYFFTVPNHG